ncbi:MAG: tryptophanase [Balneolaceae bacterium]|nr:MAG: tryptophanase [Balneolaceae bacterium]
MKLKSLESRVIIEPFRIRSVEPIRFTTMDEREKLLRDASWNPFLLKATDVLIDLLTDSGTGAMSSRQWAAMIESDESYAGSSSFYRFETAVRDITGFKHVIPTHQGRAAENVLFSLLVQNGDVIPNNTHFDTTRAHVEHKGGEARDLLIPEGLEPLTIHPFKGNMDTARLEQTIRETLGETSGETRNESRDNASGETRGKSQVEKARKKIPVIMLTVTNNSGGGQPVSMANVREVSRIARKHGIPFFIDACRFAENSWFVKIREEGYQDKTPIEIARELFSYADGCTMSAKKDGMSNIGGYLALNDDDLARECRSLSILTEGFPTYGGMAGYDMEAVAAGLYEALDEGYLRYRIRSTEYLGEKLVDAGVSIIQPTGGHAVYIDAKKMLPHIPPLQYPAWSLTNALYLTGGVRAVEIGSVMFGLQPDGTEKPAPMELVRLAIPRRVYTQSHIDYLADVVIHTYEQREKLGGYRIASAPKVLRHFSARLAPLE